MNKLFVTKFILFLCFLSGACYFFVTGWIANNAPSENGQAAFAASTRKPRTALKNIETAQVGEMVLATNPETGKTEWKKIVRVFHNTSNHLRHLTLRSESTDEVQKFETTDEHPFYVVEKGWVAAADLEIGDKVPQQNSGFAIVEATYREEKPNGVPVYNFEVEDYNTYYVAAHGARGPPVLVHNCNPVHGKPRTGSGLKNDVPRSKQLGHSNYGRPSVREFGPVAKGHGFPDIIDNYADAAKQFDLRDGAVLYQIEGSLNGVPGRFEWIIENGNVTHRQFLHGKKITGVPSK